MSDSSPNMTRPAPDASGAPPAVSIGMPVYNGERWLAETLGALRAQTWTDVEIVIADNASTDGTEAICRAHAAEDGRIRYLRNAENIGANRNYRLVLDEARGRYFKWASSNDHCAPTFVERCVHALERNPDAVLAHPRTSLFDDDLSQAVPAGDDLELTDARASVRLEQLQARMRLNNVMNGVIRLEALRRARPLQTYWAADIVLMSELALYGKFLLVAEPLFYRRMSGESATHLRKRADVDRHFEPRARRPLLCQHWRYHFGLLGVTLRSAPAGERAASVGHALRRLIWAREKLAADVVEAARRLVTHPQS